jgi:hypothetical protein
MRTLRIGVVAVLLATLLAACGNGGTSTPVARSTPAESGTPVAATTASTPAALVEVRVFFIPRGVDPCGNVAPVVRRVPGPVDAEIALRELLRGPTAEEAEAGFTSLFGPPTADVLLDATVVDRIAHVSFRDLRPILPNASASCGSASLLAALDATLTDLPGVSGARYSFGGDEAAFYEWLQMVPPD